MFQRIVWGGDVVFLFVTEGFVWIRSCSERRGGQFVGGRIGGLLVELGGGGLCVLVAVPLCRVSTWKWLNGIGRGGTGVGRNRSREMYD